MKQKSENVILHKHNIEKKNSNIVFINNSFNSEKGNHDKNINININNKKINEKIVPKSKPNNKNQIKKIKYDPYVFRMIQNRNGKKWKSNIVFCVANYLSFEECLLLRLVCKLFNDGIKLKYNFLESDILFSSDEKVFEKIRNEYCIKNKKKDKIIFKELFDENSQNFNNANDKDYQIYKDFEFNKNEVSNFSKKNILSNMIYNKYFMSIKNQSKNGKIFIPNNFII